MLYRIKWNLWRVSGSSKDDAVKTLKELLDKHPDQFFVLEDASLVDERKSLLKRFLTGR